MPDNKKKAGPADKSRVNVNQKHELRYWTEKFGISPGLLKRAVQEVGVMAKDVKSWLKDPVGYQPARATAENDNLVVPSAQELEKLHATLGSDLAKDRCDRDDVIKAFRLGLTLGSLWGTDHSAYSSLVASPSCGNH